MKFMIIFLFGVIMTSIYGFSVDISGADCSCDTFTTQLDCAATSTCEWVNSACTTIDCTTKTTVATCNVGSNCAYTTTNTCSTFTQCSDYKYADEAACLTIACISSGTKGTDGLYPCQNITAIKKCSEITAEDACTLVNCKWPNSACIAPTCSDKTTATDCIAIRSDALATRQICTWTAATSTCADATGLTQTNCAVLTLGSYYWNTDSSSCSQCPSSSYANIIAAAFSVILLTF